MKLNDVKFHCTKCGARITAPVIWVYGWDWDQGTCDACGYDGELDTMTGEDPDGSFWQTNKKDFEEEEIK